MFKENLREVEAINADPSMTHTVGVNEFSSWTPEEKKKLLGYQVTAPVPEKNYKLLDASNLADEVNWVTKGAVTPVKN